MKVAIVVGHNHVNQGKFSPFIGQTEYEYHKGIAEHLEGVDVYFRIFHNSYSNEINELCNRLNAKEYDLVLSLHFNSFNETAQGSECWAYYKNNFTKAAGQCYLEMLEDEYGFKNRGVKLITNSKQRGGQLFVKCKHPVLLLEPFFGDEPQAEVFKDKNRYRRLLQEFIQNV